MIHFATVQTHALISTDGKSRAKTSTTSLGVTNA